MNVPKLYIRVANEQRISTTKVFCPTVFTIDGHEFNRKKERKKSLTKGHLLKNIGSAVGIQSYP